MQKITIIGYGRFGKLLEKLIEEQLNQKVNIYDPRAPKRYGTRLGYHPLEDTELVIVAVPLENFEFTIDHISPLLNNKQTVIEVCSTNIYPKKIMLEKLQKNVNIIGSHPMFGPQTLRCNKGSFSGFNVVLENIRCDQKKYNHILNFIRSIGCKITELSADEHDRQAAKFHFLAQLVGNTLEPLCLNQTNIDTVSYEFLFNFMQRLDPDKELLKMMYTYNPYSKEYLEKYQQSSHEIFKFLNRK